MRIRLHQLVALTTLALHALQINAQSGNGFTVELPQAMQMKEPVASSVSGQPEAFLSADPSSRGAFTYTLPMDFDSSRAPLLISLAPTWAPGQGLSEWGHGWATQLKLKRINLSHEIDFTTDLIQSPWGLLVQASDGAWHPQGLTSRVRVHITEGVAMAVLQDGTQLQFLALGKGDKNLVWNLVRATDVRGYVATLEYGEAGQDQNYLSTVSWGLSETSIVSRIKFFYEELPDGRRWRSFRFGGTAVTLDRRISRVEFHQIDDGVEKERWRHVLSYQNSRHGPGFFLESVQKVHASGEKRPPMRFTWRDFTTHLDQVMPEQSARLQPIISSIGFTRLHGQFVNVTDFNRDGYPDIEIGQDNSVFHQSAEGFRSAVSRTIPTEKRGECRKNPDPLNPARSIMPLAGHRAEPLVVITRSTTPGASRILICSLEGTLLQELPLTGDFGPDSRVRIADLDRDGRPDLLRVQRGKYFVSRNISTPNSFAFSEKLSFPLDVSLDPSAAEPYVVMDMNGDEYLDLVMMRSGTLLVAYGKGNLVFGPEVTQMPALDRRGEVFYFQGFDLKPLDANRDGLTDLLATKTGRYALLVNDGQNLREYDLNRLQPNISFTKYLYADLLGDGLPRLIQGATGGQVKALALTDPSVSMLLSLDDGLGNIHSFSWTTAPATPHVGERPLVLSTIRLDATGEEPRSLKFTYEQPEVHSTAPMLLGFGKLTLSDGQRESGLSYFQNDAVQGLLVKKSESDRNRPGVFRNTFLDYLSSDFRGIPFQRLVRQRSGFGPTHDDLSVTSDQSWSNFDEKECARSTHVSAGLVNRSMNVEYHEADPEKFPLACLQKNVQLMDGAPSMAENSLRWSYERNDAGFITAITQHGEGRSTVLMTSRYDSLHRLAEQRWASGKLKSVGYRSSTLLIESLRDESGVVRTIDGWSEVGDLPGGIRIFNDDESYVQTYGWDGQERLSSILHGLYPPEQSEAQQMFSYRLSSATSPGVLNETRSALDGRFYSIHGIHSSLGTVLASAKASDQGYVYGGRQFRSQGGFKLSSHAPIASRVEPLLAGIDDLKGDDEPIASQLSDAFGEAIAADQVHESNVKGSMNVRLVLEDDFLRVTETQNGTWVRTRWIDGAGLIRRMKLENEAVFAFNYDWNGRLRSVMMPSGKYSEIDYDRLGRKSIVKRSEIGSIHYAYDDRTNLLSGKSFFDREGRKFRSEIHVHDVAGRLHELRHSDDKSNISYKRSYDGDTAQGRSPHQKGFLTSEEGPGYQRIFAYSLDGRIKSRKTRFDQVWVLTETMDYSWDGLLKTRRVDFQNTQSGFKKSYTVEQKQDSLGRIAEVQVDGRMVLQFTYDEFNRVLQTLDGEGWVRKPVYDSVTRQSLGWSESGAQGEKSFGFHFDERGFLASESFETSAKALVKMFAYDASGFLGQETGDGQTQKYDYDADGLRSVKRLADESGRLRSVLSHTLSYGSDGQLQSAVSPAGLIRYSHDLDGQRILKFKNGNIDTAFAGNLVMKGNKIFEILFVQGQNYGILENGMFKSIATDHIGTPFVLKDGSLDVTSAFGDGRRDEEREILAFAQEGRDIDTGLVRFGVRDYDTGTGMFTTPDPLFLENPESCIRSPIECNLFSYAKNNPLKYVDPTGLLSFDTTTPDVRAQLRGFEGYVQQGQLLGAATAVGIGGAIAIGPQLIGGAAAIGRGIGAAGAVVSDYAGALAYRGAAAVSEGITGSALGNISTGGIGAAIKSEFAVPKIFGLAGQAMRGLTTGVITGSFDVKKPEGSASLLGYGAQVTGYNLGVVLDKVVGSFSPNDNRSFIAPSSTPEFPTNTFREPNSSFQVGTDTFNPSPSSSY